MKFSIEVIMQVWNDDTGERVEIGQDSDGLDLVEIRQIENKECRARITMPNEIQRYERTARKTDFFKNT